MMPHRQAATAAIDAALQLLNEPRNIDRTYKTDRDYATSLDFLIEDNLRSLFHDLTPEIGFLGEERGHTGPRNPHWCVDPIDGTTNFVRGIPNYGVSVALVEDGTPIHGEIVLPGHRERYVTRDGVAYCNDIPIHASSTSTLDEVIVTAGDFATGEASVQKNVERISTLTNLANNVGRVRMLGSAATDLAWLATGRVDAVITHSNKPWDMAAGVAIARAAGAIVTHHDGSEYSLSGPNLIAAAPATHALILDALHDQAL